MVVKAMRCIFILLILIVSSISALAENYFAPCSELTNTSFIYINKQTFTLYYVDKEGYIVDSYQIACAKNFGNKTKRGDFKTPEGKFQITQILNAKGLSHDFKDGLGPIKDAYGPWFLRLSVPGFNDIGIHGTHLPESIGSRVTEGCIRMKNEDIIDLKNKVSLGMPVVIAPDTIRCDNRNLIDTNRTNYDCVLTYCKHDESLVGQLKEYLSENGVSCYMIDITKCLAVNEQQLDAIKHAKLILNMVNNKSEKHFPTINLLYYIKTYLSKDVLGILPLSPLYPNDELGLSDTIYLNDLKSIISSFHIRYR